MASNPNDRLLQFFQKIYLFPRAYRFVLENRVRLTAVLGLLVLLEDAIFLRRPHSLIDLQEPLGPTGLVLVLLGIAMRSWGAGMLQKNKALATSGPYTLSRHPLYLGTFLMSLGLVLILEWDWKNIVVLVLLALLVYLPKILEEERLLSGEFGEEWLAFSRRTSILFPKALPREIRAPWSGGQWLRNKEYRALSFGLVALVGLQVLYWLA